MVLFIYYGNVMNIRFGRVEQHVNKSSGSKKKKAENALAS
jgi:hypothetical protein